mmetsp:Transcript_72161/g.192908  ORF Transcript_72161/g.192908 Transcript_72161/m.192908 type:complete len:883 (-) Transcript_72161:37-2685(-)
MQVPQAEDQRRIEQALATMEATLRSIQPFDPLLFGPKANQYLQDSIDRVLLLSGKAGLSEAKRNTGVPAQSPIDPTSAGAAKNTESSSKETDDVEMNDVGSDDRRAEALPVTSSATSHPSSVARTEVPVSEAPSEGGSKDEASLPLAAPRPQDSYLKQTSTRRFERRARWWLSCIPLALWNPGRAKTQMLRLGIMELRWCEAVHPRFLNGAVIFGDEAKGRPVRDEDIVHHLFIFLHAANGRSHSSWRSLASCIADRAQTVRIDGEGDTETAEQDSVGGGDVGTQGKKKILWQVFQDRVKDPGLQQRIALQFRTQVMRYNKLELSAQSYDDGPGLPLFSDDSEGKRSLDAMTPDVDRTSTSSESSHPIRPALQNPFPLTLQGSHAWPAGLPSPPVPVTVRGLGGVREPNPYANMYSNWGPNGMDGSRLGGSSPAMPFSVFPRFPGDSQAAAQNVSSDAAGPLKSLPNASSVTANDSSAVHTLQTFQAEAHNEPVKCMPPQSDSEGSNVIRDAQNEGDKERSALAQDVQSMVQAEVQAPVAAHSQAHRADDQTLATNRVSGVHLAASESAVHGSTESETKNSAGSKELGPSQDSDSQRSDSTLVKATVKSAKPREPSRPVAPFEIHFDGKFHGTDVISVRERLENVRELAIDLFPALLGKKPEDKSNSFLIVDQDGEHKAWSTRAESLLHPQCRLRIVYCVGGEGQLLGTSELTGRLADFEAAMQLRVARHLGVTDRPGLAPIARLDNGYPHLTLLPGSASELPDASSLKSLLACLGREYRHTQGKQKWLQAWEGLFATDAGRGLAPPSPVLEMRYDHVLDPRPSLRCLSFRMVVDDLRGFDLERWQKTVMLNLDQLAMAYGDAEGDEDANALGQASLTLVLV